MNTIDSAPCSLAEKIRAVALLPVRAWLPNSCIDRWCDQAGHSWREYVYDPITTLSACIYKQLTPGRSARQIEDWIDSLCGRSGGGDGADFCRARERLPEDVFVAALQHTAEQSISHAPTWNGLRVLYVDGVTMRAPRSLDNVRAFGRSASGTGDSILPVVRVVLAACAYTGAVLAARQGAYTQGEVRLFYEMLPNLVRGALFIGDSAYNSYLAFWRVRDGGGHIVAPLDPTRRSTRLRRLGYEDELHEWERAALASSAFPEELRKAPLRQQVRVITRTLRRKGYRNVTLKLCTTLLDAKAYPATELFENYLRRWGLEVGFRSMKEHLGLARLTAKTAGNVRREILSGLLAYNIVRLAAAKSEGPPGRISFERTREILLEFCARMTMARTVQLPELQKTMLKLIGRAVVPLQKRPPEPRAILAHPTCYPVLRTSRNSWRRKYRCA